MLSLPEESYSAEEMWDIVMDMFKTSIAVEREMRRDFDMKCKDLHFMSKRDAMDAMQAAYMVAV